MNTDTDTLDRLFLELSQFTKATTAKELKLQELLKGANNICRSMSAIVKRQGNETNWEAFGNQLDVQLEAQHKFMFPE